MVDKKRQEIQKEEVGGRITINNSSYLDFTDILKRVLAIHEVGAKIQDNHI